MVTTFLHANTELYSKIHVQAILDCKDICLTQTAYFRQ